MYTDLNKKQIEIIEFLKHEVLIKGYPPAIREICAAVGLKSTSTVHGHLTKLEEKGYIKRDPSKNRAIEIVSEASEDLQIHRVVHVPVLGEVAAGAPILATENIIDSFPLPLYMANQGDLFMLKVKGESMIDIGILEDDIVVVNKQATANNGDIVVAMIDESATIKRFYKHANNIELKPENQNMESLFIDELQILGKVIGLQRQY